MSDGATFVCQKCGRRLPLVQLTGAAIVICKHCKERTQIVGPRVQTVSFRDAVHLKRLG